MSPNPQSTKRAPPIKNQQSAISNQQSVAWLQLVRAPNLFTVPGDPLVGFLLATFGVLRPLAIWAVVASLCLYAAGLLLNDLLDLEEDRRERSERPLPSGAVQPHTVWMVAGALSAAGLVSLVIGAGARGLAIGALLLGAIALYNGVTKRLPIIGALNMGLCRGLSVYAGAVVAYPSVFPRTTSVWIAAIIIALYIAAITNLARHETHHEPPLLARLFPAAAACYGVVLMILGTGPFFPADSFLQSSPATACFACGFLLVVKETISLFRQPASPLPPRIGALIRLLLIFQAALCLVVPMSEAGWVCAVILLCFYPLSSALSRRFYAS
jgi:4-hydroxybenzoate polyprenyltransferase